MKIGFIDFKDSFSFNIVQLLIETGFDVDIFAYPDMKNIWDYDLVVLGPGPGHPSEYEIIISPLKQRLMSDKKTFGICLGHQLIWSALGFNIIKSKYPLHGQKIEIKLDEDWRSYLELPKKVTVQRYNSLVVDVAEGEVPAGIVTSFNQEELQMSRTKNWLSYQFHPESVGTSCQKSFFTPLRYFAL